MTPPASFYCLDCQRGDATTAQVFGRCAECVDRDRNRRALDKAFAEMLAKVRALPERRSDA
jgi:hypothetical protein